MLHTMQNEARLLLHPYFIVNYVLCSCFFLSKLFPPICERLYDSCNVEFKEYEIFIFLACVVTMKSKRQASLVNYMAHFCMFTKICNLIMFYQQNLSYTLVFGFVWILQSSFTQKPIYRGPEKVVLFNDKTLAEELSSNRAPNTVWIIHFFTMWSQNCTNFQPVFSELSENFGTTRALRFGKIDVGRYPDAAKQYHVDTSNWSKNLPSVLVFRGGREVDRRPALNLKKEVAQKFQFTWDNLISAFDLEKLHAEQKATEKTSSKNAKNNEELSLPSGDSEQNNEINKKTQ